MSAQTPTTWKVDDLENHTQASQFQNQNSQNNIVFDPIYSPYYAALNNTSKQIYRELYYAVINLQAQVKLEGYNFSEASMYQIALALRNDQPELFWFETIGFQTTLVDGKITNIIIDIRYNDLANNLPSHKNKIEAEINKIINGTKQFNKITDKELYVHDYIIENVRYVEHSQHDQDIYGALVNHQSVCAGFAKTFQIVMRRLGVPTYYIGGHAMRTTQDEHYIYYHPEEHAWNIILINGKTYNVDVTNDKASITLDDTHTKIIPVYIYFNRTTQEMLNHKYQYSDSDFVGLTDNPLQYPPAIYTDASFENVVNPNYIINKLSKLFPISTDDIITSISEFNSHQKTKLKGPPKNSITLYTLITNKDTFETVSNYTWDDMESKFLDEATEGWQYTRKTLNSFTTRLTDDVILYRTKYIFTP